MQLKDILDPSCVKLPLESATKSQAITELLDLLAENGKIKDYDAVLRAIQQREAIRSTGVGQGFAIPHGKTPTVDRILMAIGKLDEPIDFDSIDGQPVTVIVLLISPLDQTGPHIQALARVSRLMTDKQIRDRIWQSRSSQELYDLIVQNYHESS
ncbi:MAG: PTS sugar transporter subunit IIA [Sedimentisphaerales bacterium]|nr:PTS sugar transporter subunit IIA [Sedimentisphaerales bacterium]